MTQYQTKLIIQTKVVRNSEGEVMLKPILNCQDKDDCLSEEILNLLVGDLFETELVPL